MTELSSYLHMRFYTPHPHIHSLPLASPLHPRFFSKSFSKYMKLKQRKNNDVEKHETLTL